MNYFSFDDDYVRRLVASDPVVETHFFHYFRGRLLMKLRKSVSPPSEAEDLCQRIFLIAVIALRDGRGPDDNRKLGGWMTGIARNLVSEWYRAPKPDQLDPDERDFASDKNLELDMITLERVDIVRKTVDSMSPRDAEILRAVFLEERDRDEICRQYGIDREYLRVLIHRALKRFKELYPNGT